MHTESSRGLGLFLYLLGVVLAFAEDRLDRWLEVVQEGHVVET
jgi:hypothetical protein